MKGKSTYLTVGLAVLALVVAAPAAAKFSRHALLAHAAAGTGAFGPGCTTGGSQALCDSRSFVFHLAAISGFPGFPAFGYFDRTNVANGNTFAGAVTCLSVSGNQAAVGGFVTRTPGGSGTGEPFLVYVLDNGRSAALSDGISPFAIVGPEETPVAGFPYVCPSPVSPLGYHSLTSGDIIVLGG